MACVTLTEAAAHKAKALLQGSEAPDGALRVRVVNGGCSGMRYELIFDGQKRDDDDETEQYGLRVVVDAESARFLDETTVDFVDTLNESGFKIQNPNASDTCGCGESFRL